MPILLSFCLLFSLQQIRFLRAVLGYSDYLVLRSVCGYNEEDGRMIQLLRGMSKRFFLAGVHPLFFAAVLLTGQVAYSQLTAEPSSLVFNNSNDRLLVKLNLDGKSIPPEEVLDWILFAGENSYTHMITITLTADGLLIGPSATVEVGTYTLVINTKRGPVQLPVKTPLSEHKSFLETRAEQLGVSIDKAREELGFSQRLERQQVELRLPPTYYVGDMLEVEVPQYSPSQCIWKVNDICVLEGSGQNKLRYLLKVPGPVKVVYEEWKDDALLASAHAASEVLQIPAKRYSVRVNTAVTFSGPADYVVYNWYVDKELCCHQQNIKHVFYSTGTYHVTCVCTEPQKPGLKEYQEIVYLVSVE